MTITDELIDHLASLSKLQFNDEERANMRADFQRMLDFVTVLTEVNTENVPPLVHMTEAVNELRDDEVGPTLSTNEIMQQAPNADSPFFSVPKVIDQ